jgi:cytochrome c-type biogenesis protein CcmH/NrfG
MPEMIMIFVVLIMLILPLGIAAALLWYFVLRRKAHQSAQAPQTQKSTQDRLSEIDGLRSQNLISEAEYAEKRKRILNEI